MSKKSLIAIAIIFVLGIGGFVGYINYTNTKPIESEEPVAEEPAVAATSNEKDEEGNYINTKGMTTNQVEKQKAIEVFREVMNTIWNVPNTKDEVAMADIRNIMEKDIIKNTEGDKTKKCLEENYYAKANSIAIKSLEITKVMPSKIGVKGQDQTLDGYLIYYKFEGLVNGTDIMRIHNNKDVDFATAAIVKTEDGSYKMQTDLIGNISE